MQKNYVIDIHHSVYPFNYEYQLNNIVLSARELNYARVNLKVSLNPYDSLYVDVITTYGELFLRNLFIGKNIDTSFLTRYLPNDSNFLRYQILSTSLLDSGWYLRRKLDTLPISLKDTIAVSKTMNTTYEIPLKPY